MPKRRTPPSLAEISSHCVCFNVRRAARAITQAYDRTLAPSGLRATQVTLLVALARAGAVPFTRLAGILGMDRTTFTRNVAPLKRDGLLTMRRGPDRRVKLVAITTSGRNALAAAIPLWEQAQRRITGGIGAGRWDALRREIEHITVLAGKDTNLGQGF
jgi:DNA-binding MarR family transcriptional regulator